MQSEEKKIKIQWIQDEKFNDVSLNLRVLIPLRKFDRTVANLLSKMMGDRLINNPSKESMSQRLDMLYGLKLRSSTYVLGKYQVIDLQAYGINEKFVDEDLLYQQVAVLSEMLKEPLLNEALLDEAKKNLRMQHQRLKENHSQQAVLNAMNIAGENQFLSLSSIGDLSDIDKIDLNVIKDFHQRVLNEFPKVLTIVGDVEKIDISDLFSDLSMLDFESPYSASDIEPKRIEEFHSGSQTELILLYDIDLEPNSKDSVAMMLYTAYIGQLPTSVLFQEIREKHSLCYSIYANRYVFDGVFMIHTGIDDKNIDKTIKLIEEELELQKKGIKNLDGIKKAIISRLEGSKEDLQSLSSRAFTDLLKNTSYDLDVLKEMIMDVSETDILNISQRINNPFIYVYRGEENEEN